MSSADISQWLNDLATFGTAVVNHVAAGMPQASDDLQSARKAVCSSCDKRNVNTCTSCHCYLPLKTTWMDSDCPEGKWLIDPGVQESMDCS